VAKTLDQFVSDVCGVSRARVYIGHAHVARPSRLQQQELGQTFGFPVQQKDKLGSETQFRKPRRARCDESSRVETSERGGGARVWHFTHLPSGATPHLICWSISFPTFHVGLNLAHTLCLCAANKLGCISHGLTHMDFEIS
jgi:hypothetical protein